MGLVTAIDTGRYQSIAPGTWPVCSWPHFSHLRWVAFIIIIVIIIIIIIIIIIFIFRQLHLKLRPHLDRNSSTSTAACRQRIIPLSMRIIISPTGTYGIMSEVPRQFHSVGLDISTSRFTWLRVFLENCKQMFVVLCFYMHREGSVTELCSLIVRAVLTLSGPMVLPYRGPWDGSLELGLQVTMSPHASTPHRLRIQSLEPRELLEIVCSVCFPLGNGTLWVQCRTGATYTDIKDSSLSSSFWKNFTCMVTLLLNQTLSPFKLNTPML